MPAVGRRPIRRGAGQVAERAALVALRVLAAGLLLTLVVGLVVLATPRRHHGSFPATDYRADLAAARTQAPYTVVAPEDLPPGWRPVSVRVTGVDGGVVSWQVGFRTPGDRRAAVVQSNAPPARFVASLSSDGQLVGEQRVDGVWWERRFRESKGQRSLVRRLGPVTVIVTGTAAYTELGRLAAALRPEPG